MAKDRFVTAQFCDDIRQEIGNKVSLMGCYGHSMVVGTLPVVLPKLCAHVKVYTPINRPFARLSVRLLREEELLGEMQFPPDALATDLHNTHHISHAKWRMTTAVIALSPFPIEKPCRLSVEADTEEGVVNGGSFWIEQAPSTN